jgi:hypothetical protein
MFPLLGLIFRRCRFCARSLGGKDFAQGKAVTLLGSHFCSLCLERCTLFCHVCRIPLLPSDFEDGRALRLLGERYCLPCLRLLISTSAQRSPVTAGGPASEPFPFVSTEPLVSLRPPLPCGYEGPRYDTGAEKRLFARFIPPIDCRLTLRLPGLQGLFRGILVHHWLDVSAGGFRAIVSRSLAPGLLLSGSVHRSPGRQHFDFDSQVRHAHGSRSVQGDCVAGFSFRDASAELRHFLRTYCVHPTIPTGAP